MLGFMLIVFGIFKLYFVESWLILLFYLIGFKNRTQQSKDQTVSLSDW